MFALRNIDIFPQNFNRLFQFSPEKSYAFIKNISCHNVMTTCHNVMTSCHKYGVIPYSSIRCRSSIRSKICCRVRVGNGIALQLERAYSVSHSIYVHFELEGEAQCKAKSYYSLLSTGTDVFFLRGSRVIPIYMIVLWSAGYQETFLKHSIRLIVIDVRSIVTTCRPSLFEQESLQTQDAAE